MTRRILVVEYYSDYNGEWLVVSSHNEFVQAELAMKTEIFTSNANNFNFRIREYIPKSEF